jgi:hypothetical protein
MEKLSPGDVGKERLKVGIRLLPGLDTEDGHDLAYGKILRKRP